MKFYYEVKDSQLENKFTVYVAKLNSFKILNLEVLYL